jgi:ABC-type lipoprotein release transport system permease subunit
MTRVNQFIAALIPARQAVRVEIVQALRYE